MFRKILFGLLVCLFILGASKSTFAMPCGSRHSEHRDKMQLAQADMGNMQMNTETATTETVKKAEDVGNKICPVSGEEIDEKTKATYEYKGKIYNFCCPMCIDEFKKDPEKYIKKVEEELQGKAATAESVEKTETKATEETEHHHGQGM